MKTPFIAILGILVVTSGPAMGMQSEPKLEAFDDGTTAFAFEAPMWLRADALPEIGKPFSVKVMCASVSSDPACILHSVNESLLPLPSSV